MDNFKSETRVEQYLAKIVENTSGGGGGGGGGVLIVHEDETATLDKTWQEIRTAMATGIVAIAFSIAYEDQGIDYLGHLFVTGTEAREEGYGVETANGAFYAAETADDYPVRSGDLGPGAPVDDTPLL